MSASTVNTAVWNFLQGIPGVTVLHQACPFELLGDEWQTGGVPGTPAYLHWSDTTEDRITAPAVNGGQKARTYTYMFVCLYQWVIPTDLSGTATGGRDAWVTGQLALIDNVLARIQSDPAFGTNGTPIFEAGNQQGGLKVGRGQPERAGGKVMAWFHVEFTVTEILVA